MSGPALPASVLNWLAQILGSDPLRTSQRLNGATSSTLFALQTASGRRLVLRMFTNEDWLRDEPDAPLHEAENLRRLSSSGLPLPELVGIDPRGEHCTVPVLLMTRLPGQVSLTPADPQDWLHQLAGVLPRLHAVSPTGHPWEYFPYNELTRLEVPSWTGQPDRWQCAIQIAAGPPPPFAPTFIHRDYHPVNVLFEDGRLSGLVDWPNGCVGPAGVDVAHCRINLASMYGVETADRFLAACQAAMRAYWEYDPFWDLISILDWLPGPPDVYPPWLDFGLSDLTQPLMQERMEDYLASVLARFP